jgi:hypothetical protein
MIRSIHCGPNRLANGYPHPLLEGWEALRRFVATSAFSTGSSMKPSAASKP